MFPTLTFSNFDNSHILRKLWSFLLSAQYVVAVLGSTRHFWIGHKANNYFYFIVDLLSFFEISHVFGKLSVWIWCFKCLVAFLGSTNAFWKCLEGQQPSSFTVDLHILFDNLSFWKLFWFGFKSFETVTELTKWEGIQAFPIKFLWFPSAQPLRYGLSSDILQSGAQFLDYREEVSTVV